MKRIISILFLMLVCLQMQAQSDYISYNRYEEADRFDDLNGDKGILILSEYKDLVISIVGVNKKSYTPHVERPDGYFEYRIIIDADITKPKVVVSRLGSVYTTEFIVSPQQDYYVAYRIEITSNQILYEDQTMANDVHLNASEGAIEFRTSLKNLQVVCASELKATISREVSKDDPNISIVKVIVPIDALNVIRNNFDDYQADYEKKVSLLKEEYSILDAKGSNKNNAEWDRYDELEADLKECEQEFQEKQLFFNKLTRIELYVEGSNHLFLETLRENEKDKDTNKKIYLFGPRKKKSYVVSPRYIEVTKYATESNSYLSEGGKLFEMRKYEEARTAYQSALDANDVEENMRPVIQEYISRCDSCIEYEGLAAFSVGKIVDLKKQGSATQEDIYKYASAAKEFLEIVYSYNPSASGFYQEHIEKLEQLLENIPLKIRFTIVEWKTLNEGNFIPGVEVWAYYGTPLVSSATFSSDKKFERMMKKETFNYKQIGVSDSEGIVEVELDRNNLPEGLLFRPNKERNIKIEYMSLAELESQTSGTYKEKQFRLRMYTK